MSAEPMEPRPGIVAGIDLGKLREVVPRDLALRFAFGAGISIIAGLAGLLVSSRFGGMFLAFPAILPATLTLLEEVGVLSHAHLEGGAEYHRAEEAGHVHLTCSNCGAEDDLSLEEAEALSDLIERHREFLPDLTHFAISGLCAECRRLAG